MSIIDDVKNLGAYFICPTCGNSGYGTRSNPNKPIDDWIRYCMNCDFEWPISDDYNYRYVSLMEVIESIKKGSKDDQFTVDEKKENIDR